MRSRQTEEIRRAVAGAAVVVHAAYARSPSATEAQCRRLLEAMAAEGVENLLHLSSIAIYGDREGRVDESMAATSVLSGYAAGKVACEELVRNWIEASASSDRRAIVLRPGIVYGTAASSGSTSLARGYSPARGERSARPVKATRGWCTSMMSQTS